MNVIIAIGFSASIFVAVAYVIDHIETRRNHKRSQS